MDKHITIATTLIASLAATAGAQIQITSWTVDGGGTTVSLGAFQLSATIGQADATSPVVLGAYAVTGGYWGTGSNCPACPADYTNDGGIDGDDVIAFFGDWDVATGCADVTNDGGIDGDDVILFFEQWDAGGC